LFRSSETNNDYGGVEFGNHPGDITSYRKGAIYYVSDGTGFGRGSIYICNDNAGDSNNVQPSDAKVVITTAGNVGIGATTVQSLLHLSASALTDLRFTDTGETTDQKNWVFQTGTGIGAGTFRLRAINDANSSGENAYVITKSGTSIQTHQWLTGGTERARITSAGLVGIGTSSPIGTLDVATAGDSSIVLANETTYTDGIKRARITKKSDNSLVIQACDSASSVDTIFRRAISTESARIDSSGRLLVGTSAGYGVASSGLARFQVGSTAADIHASLTDWSNLNQGGVLAFGAARGGAVGDYTVVQNGDNLGSMRFAGADGTDLQSQGASIAAQVDGTPGANDMPGRLVFSTTADGASSPTERLRITSAGLVGIGTSSPSTPLHIQVSRTSSTNAVCLTLSDNVTGGQTDGVYKAIRSKSNNGASESEIRFLETSGANNDTGIAFATQVSAGALAERLRIDELGRVGIGTTSPSHRLHVGNTADNTKLLVSSSFEAALELQNGGGAELNVINSAGSGNLSFRVSNSEKARLDSSGRLLVGTSSYTGNATIVAQGHSGDSAGPAHLLLKTGSTSPASGGDLGYLFFGDANTSGGFGAWILGQRDGGTWTSGSSMPGRLQFSTTADGASSPTERMRITNAGLIGMGTTDPTATPSQGFCFDTRSDSIFRIGHANGTGSGSNYVIFGYNSGAIGSIYQNGTTGVTYSTSSDYRLKENVVAINDGITRLQQLKPSRFSFIAEPGRTIDGFLAHEVQGTVPEAISGTKDEVDAEGNPVYQGIDQSKLVPLLTAALQEAVAEIKALKDRVTALEGA
jgi:hypothetical protein